MKPAPTTKIDARLRCRVQGLRNLDPKGAVTQGTYYIKKNVVIYDIISYTDIRINVENGTKSTGCGVSCIENFLQETES